jgi:peptidylamidoglycolate lyase
VRGVSRRSGAGAVTRLCAVCWTGLILAAWPAGATEPSWALVDGWGLAASQGMTNVTGVAIDAAGNVFVAGGIGNPVVVLNPEGNVIDCWGDFIGAVHGLRVFGNRVFVTDSAEHVVYVCTRSGEILHTLGVKGQPGEDARHFNKPTDVALADDGAVYVADGYGNSRIVCLAPDLTYRFAWGSAGARPGEFVYPHNLVFSGNRLYVADRGNHRIQVFEPGGELLAVWTHVGKPFGLAAAADGTVYVSHIGSPYGVGHHGIMHLTADGAILERFGREGRAAGEFLVPHSLAFSADERMLVVGEVTARRVQCFRALAP